MNIFDSSGHPIIITSLIRILKDIYGFCFIIFKFSFLFSLIWNVNIINWKKICVLCVKQDRINNNSTNMSSNRTNLDSPKSPLETLDHLLETIAIESYSSSTYVTELVNGDRANNNNININKNNNIHINQKTDTLNRYLDNVINYNTRKSDSDSSHSSDHHHANTFHGKMPPHQLHQHRQVISTNPYSSLV